MNLCREKYERHDIKRTHNARRDAPIRGWIPAFAGMDGACDTLSCVV
jgi:hypothetical protein